MREHRTEHYFLNFLISTNSEIHYPQHMTIRPCVYILASKKNGTLYVGVTSNLGLRLETHRSGAEKGFTTKYSVH